MLKKCWNVFLIDSAFVMPLSNIVTIVSLDLLLYSFLTVQSRIFTPDLLASNPVDVTLYKIYFY